MKRTPNCKSCDFKKPCEDPIIGDFYCNYKPDVIETYRWSHIEDIECPLWEMEKPQPIPVSRNPSTVKPAPQLWTPVKEQNGISPDSIEDPELRAQAAKLAKMQEELMAKIAERDHKNKVDNFFDTEYDIISYIQERFLNGQIKVNNLVDNADFNNWAKKTFPGSKKGTAQFVLLGYILGKYTKGTTLT